MSWEYDLYLKKHKENVVKGLNWFEKNIPYYVEKAGPDAAWSIRYKHDISKYESDEYDAYDRYFYGNNKSFKVVQDYKVAWLTHIHRNPHHWQHWILINDDPNEGEIVLDMPFDYILEMICDWWSFSWNTGNLYEIFDWYDKHKEYIKLSGKTRTSVEAILNDIKEVLDAESKLEHHGIKGQKWGVKNGPPYPLEKKNLTNADGKEIIVVDKTELHADPNSITQKVNKKGGIDRNYYDENGRQSKQVSNNNHGRPEKHPYGEHGEHAHDYIYDEDGNLKSRKTRELNDEERKENSDIL